jgi:peptide-methionine (S)-S-oxide reductase
VWIVILISAAAVLFLLYVFVLARPRAATDKNSGLLREYAHRGLYGGDIPENSLAAFERAIKEGTGIELDVQLSSDGEVFVFHDSNVNRMTGCDRAFCSMTAEEIKSLRLSDTDEKIPLFTDVLKLINGQVPVLVELKGENLDTSLCDKVAPILNDYRGPYLVESFNPFLINKIKKLVQGVTAGQLYTNVYKDQKKYNPVTFLLTLMAFNIVSRPDFIAYNKEYRKSFPVLLTTKFFRAAKFVWTVTDDDELSFAREHGEYAIFERIRTDRSFSSAYFAGGCFWCITPDFKEKGGVLNVIAGFSGGDEINPSYSDVKHQKTGHRETIKVDYDSRIVSFSELFDVFLANVDPFDDKGQYIDRGHSYTLALYFSAPEEERIAHEKISELEKNSGRKVYISIEPLKNFYEAGKEHQDYYLKHPEEFACELVNSGRKKNKNS